MTDEHNSAQHDAPQDTLSAYLRHIRNAEASLGATVKAPAPPPEGPAAKTTPASAPDEVEVPLQASPQDDEPAQDVPLERQELAPEPRDVLEDEADAIATATVAQEDLGVLASQSGVEQPVTPADSAMSAQHKELEQAVTPVAPEAAQVAQPVTEHQPQQAAHSAAARRNWTVRGEDGLIRTTKAYPDLESWLEENELHPDLLVTIVAWPLAHREVPERLINALLQAAYSIGSGYPFQIKLPGANNKVLLGYAGGDSPPYGVLDLLPSMYSAYRDMRQAFVHYQHLFPAKVNLETGETIEGLGEIMMAKLRTMLLAAKQGADEASESAEVEVADLLAGAIDAVLREVFSGLAPRDEIGRILQDPARMVAARKAWLLLGDRVKVA